jgi:hypothetical protein
MEKETNNKKTLIILASVLGLLILIAGFFLIGKDEQAAVVVENSSNNVSASIINANALNIISQINSLELDKNLFDDPNFISLTDRTRDVIDEPVRRENPFSAIR